MRDRLRYRCCCVQKIFVVHSDVSIEARTRFSEFYASVLIKRLRSQSLSIVRWNFLSLSGFVVWARGQQVGHRSTQCWNVLFGFFRIDWRNLPDAISNFYLSLFLFICLDSMLIRVCVFCPNGHKIKCARNAFRFKSNTFLGNRIFHYFLFWLHSLLISKTTTPWRWKYWWKSVESLSNMCFVEAQKNRGHSASPNKWFAFKCGRWTE